MKKHNAFFVVIFTLLLIFVLSWALPVTILNGSEFVVNDRSPMGLIELFTYPSYLMFNFVNVFLVVVLVGGFYAVLGRVSAYRKLLDKIVSFVRGKEVLFSVITVLLLSLIVAFTGFTYEAIIFFPLIIAIVLLLGYDKITAMLMTLGTVATGFMSSMFSKSVNGTLNGVLNSNGSIVGYTDLIWVKVITFVLANAILILNIIFYAKKHRDTKNVSKSIFVPEKVKVEGKSGKTTNKVWPLVVILCVTFLLFVLGTINWSDAFKITWFSDILEKFNELVIFGYPLLSKIVGNIAAFGEWSYIEYMVLLTIVMMIIKLVYRVKFADFIDGLFEGMKNYFYAAILMVFSYVILISTSNHPVMLTVLKPILQLTDGFHSITFIVSTFISALFSTDMSFFNYVIFNLKYVVGFVSDTSVYALTAFITQTIYGVVLLVAPTSIVLLFGLSTLEISYLEWLKKIWKLFLELLLLVFAIVTVVLLII